MRIDAHHHFLTHGRFDYPWLGAGLEALKRDFTLDDLRPCLREHEVDQTVLVQTIKSVDETRHFLQLAATEPEIAGVVGWVDLTDPDVGRTLDELQPLGPLVGIRHQVHDEPDIGWLDREDVRRGLAQLVSRRLVYDLLIRPEHLTASLQLARDLPDLSLVVDHIAKPDIKQRGWDAWATGLAELARYKNVACKLSGMITEADWDHWQPEDLQPYVRHAVESFAADRLMFGSDWPVCLLAGSYERVVNATEAALGPLDLTPQQRTEIFGDTATRVYRLNGNKP